MAENPDTSGEVVLRKPKEKGGRFKVDHGLRIDDEDGQKKVKWSDSTELREKMKEYRRSRFSLCLDYQHIAVDEEREREGVKKWREIKDRLENTEEEEEEEKGEEKTTSVVQKAPEEKETTEAIRGGEEEEEEDEEEDEDDQSDSDDDPYCDTALEAKLRVIKAKASRFTLLPAYTAAVNTYETWFQSPSFSASPKEDLDKMTSQLNTYKEILCLYAEWNESGDVDLIDACYQRIAQRIIEAKKLGPPPEEVAQALASILNDERNIKKHRDTYSSMVEDMVTDLSKQIQETAL